jgi:hypothetical protein
MAQSSEPFHVFIVHTMFTEAYCERFTVELRVMPGSGNGAHIDNELYGMGFQDREEFLQKTGRVADGINGWHGIDGRIVRGGNHDTL